MKKAAAFVTIVAVVCAAWQQSDCRHVTHNDLKRHVQASTGRTPTKARPPRHRHRTADARSKRLTQGIYSLTVVSAFYHGTAKHSAEEYAQWGANFMRIQAPLVFFTNDRAAISAARIRPRNVTHIIIRNPDDFYVSNLGVDWDAQLKLDPERYIHSAHLFRVWLEKTHFVMAAMRMNVYGSAYFAWMDYGYFRRKGEPAWVPSPAYLPPGKMLMLNTSTLHANPAKIVGGGALAGDIKAWRTWNRTFYETLMTRYGKGKFVGDDQTTMSIVAVQYPGLVCLAHPVHGYGDAWFSISAVLDGRAGNKTVAHCFMKVKNH